jgi:phosphate transport system protein
MAVDLRLLLSAMKIAGKIERIADYAANVAKRVNYLTQEPDKDLVHLILEMANISQEMLTDVMEAYVKIDSEKAIIVWDRDDEIDRKFARAIRMIRQQMENKALSVEDGTQLIFMGRCCERIGDHITNIAEDIYYIKTGQNYIGHFDD